MIATPASAKPVARWNKKDGDMRIIGVFRLCRIGIMMAALAVAPAVAQTPVRVAFDWKFEGPAAPFLVAIDRGYFSAEGLDVSIEPGTGSVEPIARVASGSYDIGFGDINTLIKFRDQNATPPIKAVFMVYNRPPFSIVTRKSRGINVPKDLEGKRLGAPAGDGAFAQWPVFAQVNGIDAAKVKIENIAFAVREPMLAAGQVDAITGFSFSAYISLKDRGVPVDDIVLMLMAEHGLSLYGNAIVVSRKFAAEKPEAVRAFLRAFLQGLKHTVRDPVEAVESVLRRNDVAKRETELERLRMAIRDSILTPEVKRNGYGAIEPNRLEAAIEQIALTHKFKIRPGPADIFDLSFLPSEADRRVH
jgi:NitT/TauT family transport system substrate-binding protein